MSNSLGMLMMYYVSGQLNKIIEMFNLFMIELNSLVPGIQFTHEIETGNSLPFLDVKIIREGQSFKYKVYRKPN